MTNQTPDQYLEESFTLPPEWVAVSVASNDCHTLIDQASAAIKRGETERAQQLLDAIGTRLDLAELEVRGLIERVVGDDGQTYFRHIELETAQRSTKDRNPIAPSWRSRQDD